METELPASLSNLSHDGVPMAIGGTNLLILYICCIAHAGLCV